MRPWAGPDRWPALVGPDAGHTTMDGNRGTLGAMVAKSRVAASNQGMTMAGTALCWMVAVAIGYGMALVFDAVAIVVGHPLPPNCRNCDCPVSWPMAMRMDVYSFDCNHQSRATWAPLLCMGAADIDRVDTMDGPTCSLLIAVVGFSDCRMLRQRPPAAVAPATGNGFWTNLNGDRNGSHSLTSQREDIYASDTLCMPFDSFYW